MSEAIGSVVVDRLSESTGFLWTLMVAFFIVGDLLTTMIGLGFDRVVEAGPITAAAVSHGSLTMGALKLVAVAVCVGLWRATPTPYRVGVPLGLGLLGVVATAWNLTVILLVAY